MEKSTYQEKLSLKEQMLTPSKRKTKPKLSVPYHVQKMVDHFQDRKGCIPSLSKNKGLQPCPALLQNLQKQKRWKIPVRLFPKIHLLACQCWGAIAKGN